MILYELFLKLISYELSSTSLEYIKRERESEKFTLRRVSLDIFKCDRLTLTLS